MQENPQDVAAEVFGVGQVTVSRSIDQMAPIVKRCVPIPAKLCAKAKRVSTIEELEEFFRVSNTWGQMPCGARRDRESAVRFRHEWDGMLRHPQPRMETIESACH